MSTVCNKDELFITFLHFYLSRFDHWSCESDPIASDLFIQEEKKAFSPFLGGIDVKLLGKLSNCQCLYMCALHSSSKPSTVYSVSLFS